MRSSMVNRWIAAGLVVLVLGSALLLGGVLAAQAGTSVPPLPGSPTPAWWRVTSPDIGGLGAVTGVGANDVWAAAAGGALHWDGTGWQSAPTPVPSPTPFGLWDASAGASDSVWGVGLPPAGPGPSYMSHWDGRQWTTIPISWTLLAPAPEPGPLIFGVSAYSADAAYAVYDTGAYEYGATGLLQCSPAGCRNAVQSIGPSQHMDGLAVVAFGAGDAWIAGYQYDETPGPVTTTVHTLLLHWDGHTLTQPAAPDVAELDGIGGSAPDDVWAVGGAGFLHWDGQTWQQAPSPAGASAVSAGARDDAWTVGGAGFLHWDGQAWSQVPGAQGSLNDVLALAAGDAWAVGADAQGRSLTERYIALPAFTDVPVAAPFYPYVAWLADHGYAGGYTCGGPGEPCGLYPRPYYRPGAAITRAQLLKLVVLAAGWAEPTPTSATFADVPPAHPFFGVVEAGAAHGIISGYACGGPGEPCDSQHRPYFRPYAAITRGQLAKVISLARGYPLPPPGSPPTFADVPPANPFYGYVEAAAAAGVISGYGCGGPGEPCPGRYFRPAAGATRGQVAKLVALAYNGAAPAKP